MITELAASVADKWPEVHAVYLERTFFIIVPQQNSKMVRRLADAKPTAVLFVPDWLPFLTASEIPN
jgi:hypothetical protein